MRTPNNSTIFYDPGIVPENPAGMRRFMQDELVKLSTVITALALGQLDVTHVLPAKPRDGMIRYFDGTDVNPGSGGEGVYAYYNSTWNRLG